MNIKNSIVDLVGNTPLLRLSAFEKNNNLNAKIVGKLEYLNPAGSIKDRVAKAIIEDYETRGILNKERNIIIEPTSGNTGIGLASIASSKGYKVIITMPDTMSKERISLMKAYGAEVILTDGSKGMKGAIEKAEELNKVNKNSIIAGQFINEANPNIHYRTTGPEIWEDSAGSVDIFVAGVGTGGTITGVGKYLKEKNPNIKIVAVEPETSPVLSSGVSGKHKIQGIGAGFVPKFISENNFIDEIITVSNENAYITAKEIVRSDGILVGISSGAALYASKVLGAKKENINKTIVVMLPDTGDRYLSVVGLFD